MAPPRTISVLLVEDHALVRDGIRAHLSVDEFQVVAEASTGADAILLAAQHRPDVVLLDLGLPDRDGACVCQAILDAVPSTVVIVLSARADSEAVLAATDAGALAYLLKSSEALDLPRVIRTVLQGQSVLDPQAARAVLTRLRHPVASDLTPQELNVVALVAEGLTNREIGERLGISPHTVKEYLSAAMRKLDASSRIRVVLHATRAGLLPDLLAAPVRRD